MKKVNTIKYELYFFYKAGTIFEPEGRKLSQRKANVEKNSPTPS